MSSSAILSIVTFVYGLAAFFYLSAWLFQNPLTGKLGTWTTVLGLAGGAAGIVKGFDLLFLFFTQTCLVIGMVKHQAFGNVMAGPEPQGLGVIVTFFKGEGA